MVPTYPFQGRRRWGPSNVGKREGRPSVPTVGRADNRLQRRVLRDLELLSIAKRPALRSVVTPEQNDLSQQLVRGSSPRWCVFGSDRGLISVAKRPQIPPDLTDKPTWSQTPLRSPRALSVSFTVKTVASGASPSRFGRPGDTIPFAGVTLRVVDVEWSNDQGGTRSPAARRAPRLE